ncbi:bestrophin-like domain [Labrys neptuniae]
MTPDMIYQYPTWAIGLLVISAAIVGSVLLELCARRLLPLELRRGHNDVAAAIFSIIGVTYAVLLAFVAMLAWEGFNKAKAASYAEASVVGGLYNLTAGLSDPEKTSAQKAVMGYARHVVTVEWPRQAQGRPPDLDSAHLDDLNKMALNRSLSDQADRDVRLLLLQTLQRLWDARHERLLAAQSTIPDVVWFVLIAGGALTVSFGSFLGAPSVRMQIAMSAVLAASGALVLTLIVALSNPFRGDFRVSTAPFEDALSRMETDAARQ